MDDLNKETFEKTFKTKTRDEWDSIFKNSDACVSPVLELDEATKHKHNIERNSFLTLEDGTIVPRMSWLNDFGTKSNNYKLPEYGEHTIEILSEIGYSKDEIKSFLDNGTVTQADLKSKL